MWDLEEDLKNTTYKLKPYPVRNSADNKMILWQVKFGGILVTGFFSRQRALDFIKEDYAKTNTREPSA